MIELLDCSLREGAYINKHFCTNKVLNKTIQQLDLAGVEYIEIGFLENQKTIINNTFVNCDEVDAVLDNASRKTKICLLADCARYSLTHLGPQNRSCIEYVRVTFFPYEVSNVVDYCTKVKELGYKVFVQLLDIGHYKVDELRSIIKQINELKPYCLTLVDTYGSLFSEEFEEYILCCEQYLDDDIKIGIHIHNNMNMAVGTSLEMLRKISQHDVVIDGCVEGIGRGAGNAPIEILAYYMNKKYGATYDVEEIIKCAEYFKRFGEWNYGYNIEKYICGVKSSHVNTFSFLKDNGMNSSQIYKLLDCISEIGKKRYCYDELKLKMIEWKMNRKEEI